jgi:hypothetical protein
MKLLNIFAVISIISLFACNKNEKDDGINPCANGKKDAGETEVDCGGSCPDCPTYPYMVLRRDNDVKQLSNKGVVKEGDYWFLTGGFDSILFQINLGTDLTEGIWPIDPNLTGAVMANKAYSFVSGVVGISKNDINRSEISGNFEVKFVNQQDTLRLNDGQFEHLKY